jgi:hypothetical protein
VNTGEAVAERRSRRRTNERRAASSFVEHVKNRTCEDAGFPKKKRGETGIGGTVSPLYRVSRALESLCGVARPQVYRFGKKMVTDYLSYVSKE